MEVDADADPVVEYHRWREATGLRLGADGPERRQAVHLEGEVSAPGVGMKGEYRELRIRPIIEKDATAGPHSVSWLTQPRWTRGPRAHAGTDLAVV